MPDSQHHNFLNRNLALDVVRVTEAAALAASRQVGRGDEKAAEEAAMQWMQQTLETLAINGTVVIGQPAEAPYLRKGSRIGSGGAALDIALDPLEGTTIAAKGGENALSVVAMAESGAFFDAPDVHMHKIAVGPGLPDGLLDLDAGPQENLRRIAEARRGSIAELQVCILDRPRHAELIREVREAGARIMLIADGDVSGIIATTQPESGVDVYMGIGGAQEGVLAAAALRCIGGQMQARLHARGDEDRLAILHHGIEDAHRKYDLADLIAGDVMFAATGVTNGAMLRGVRRYPGRAMTHSIVMRSHTGTVRLIETQHDFRRKSFGMPGEGEC